METEVFNRSNSSTGNESSNGNGKKRAVAGVAAAAVGAVGGAATVYAATNQAPGAEPDPTLIDPAVTNPTAEVIEKALETPLEEELTFAEAKPEVTHVTNNHYHNHFDRVEPEPEIIHVVHHDEPMPQFSGTPETVINIHEDIVNNHILVQEPLPGNPVDVIANDILAQGEFVDPMAVNAQNLDIASVDIVETIDGQKLTAASFTSPSGDDMYLVDVPDTDPLAVPDMSYTAEIPTPSGDDTLRFLAQGVADIAADHIGGETGDIIHEVNGLVDLI